MLFQMLTEKGRRYDDCYPEFSHDPEQVYYPPKSNSFWRYFSLVVFLATALIFSGYAQQAPIVVTQNFDSLGTSGKVKEMIELTDGSALVCGFKPDGQGFIAKFDACHRLIWQRGYQFGSGPTMLMDLLETNDGNLLAVGNCKGWLPDGEKHGMILHLDANGAMLNPVPIFVSQDSGSIDAIEQGLNGDGYVVVENKAAPFLFQQARSWLHKLDGNIAVQWSTECHDYGLVTELSDLIAVNAHGYFMSGWTGYNTFTGTSKMSFWKVDAAGLVAWYNSFAIDTTPSVSNAASALAWDASTSTMIVAGHVYRDSNNESEECWLRVQPSDGLVLQTVVGNSPKHDRILDVKTDAQGRIFACGYREGHEWFQTMERGRSTVLIYSATGQVQDSFELKDASQPNDHYQAESLILKPNLSQGPHFLAAGHRYGVLNGLLITTDYDTCTVNVEEKRVNPVMRLSAYPNPVHTRGTVKVDLGQAGGQSGSLELFDISGNLIESTEIAAGSKSASCNAPSLPGIYILRFNSGENAAFCKLIVLD